MLTASQLIVLVVVLGVALIAASLALALTSLELHRTTRILSARISDNACRLTAVERGLRDAR